MLDAIKQDAHEKMMKATQALKADLAKLRTGRAHPSLLEHIRVGYYGSMVPLSQVGNISVENARTLTISVWEKGVVQDIEKALITSDLGLNPAVAGTVIRIPLPMLTEERRKELVKLVQASAERARVSVRTARRDANNELKRLLKDKEISEDEERRGQGLTQKLTDHAIKEIEEIGKSKEQDLMRV